MTSPYELLARNDAWASDRLLAACEGLSAADWTAPRTGFFPSIEATVRHLHMVALFYLDAIEEGGLGYALRDPEPFADAAEARAAQRKAGARFVAAARDRDMDRTVDVERPHGMTRERISDLILHLAQHQTHHRGQVHAMLSGTPVAPPQLDEFLLAMDRDPAHPVHGAAP